MTRSSTSALAVLVSVLARAGAAGPRIEDLKTVDGFTLEIAAGPDVVRFPMFAALDETGRLLVTESSGGDLYAELQAQTRRSRVRLLEDANHDGRYERSAVFADGLVFPMGIAVRGGDVYVPDPPNLLVLRDENGDGTADRRTVIATGFGHKDNGSLHGLVFGPDGLLYMTMGSPDGYRVHGAGGEELSGTSGALLRCRPDGTAFEVIARGFENLVEIVFLSSGEIVGTDNWFQLPDRGLRDALVHLVEGGHYPRHPDDGSPKPRTGVTLPAIELFPAVALSGLCQPQLRRWAPQGGRCILSAQHNARAVGRHLLTRSGATLKSTSDHLLTTDHEDFHPSDVLEDADGSLLVLDTGSWYIHHCPTGRIRAAPWTGMIVRVRGGVPRSDVDEPHLSLGLIEARARLLDPLPLFRCAAAESLARWGNADDVPALLGALETAEEPFLEHALVFAILRLAKRDQLLTALERGAPRGQAAALTILDQPPWSKATLLAPERVIALTTHENATLRSAAVASIVRHREWAPHTLRAIDAKIRSRQEALRDEERESGELARCVEDDPNFHALLGRLLADKELPLLSRVRAVRLAETLSPEVPPAAWIAPLLAVLETERDLFLRTLSLRALENLKADAIPAALLERIAADPNDDPHLRLSAIRQRVAHGAALSEIERRFLLDRVGPASEPLDRVGALGLLTRQELNSATMIRLLELSASDPLIPLRAVLAAPIGAMQEAEGRRVLESLAANPTLETLSLNTFDALIARLPSSLKPAASALRERMLAAALDQRERLDALAPSLQGGDAKSGREVFVSSRTGCAGCHTIGDARAIVGPDLTRIAAVRSGRDLLESIVFPSASFAQRFEPFLLALKSGELLPVVMDREETRAIEVHDAAGTRRRVRREEIRSLEPHPISLMPEGLAETLGEAALRDLLAYLLSLR